MSPEELATIARRHNTAFAQAIVDGFQLTAEQDVMRLIAEVHRLSTDLTTARQEATDWRGSHYGAQSAARRAVVERNRYRTAIEAHREAFERQQWAPGPASRALWAVLGSPMSEEPQP